MLQRAFLSFGIVLTAAFLLAGQTPTKEAEQTQTSDADHDYVRMFQFSSDGKTIVVQTFDGTLLWWDLETRKLLRSKQTKSENATFDPQGKLLSIVRDKTGTRVIEVIANQEVKSLEGANFTSLSKFAFSPDAETLAFTESTQGLILKLWDVTTGKEKASIERPDANDFLNTLLFSPDGQMLAGLSHSITLWSVSSGKPSRSIKIDAGLARMAFTPDGKMICISGFDNANPSFIKCFSVLSGREVLNVHAEPSSPFAFSPDGKMLAVVRSGEGIFLSSAATGRDIARVTISVGDSSLTEMSFSPDGKLLAAASDKGLVLLDPVAGKELFVLAQTSDAKQ